MKSTTSRSLAPRASCARIWLRRSTARPAFDSASDWFWQTRQRSSAARSMTRLSSAASSAKATEAARRNARALFAIEFIDQRDELFLDQLVGDRADALVADHAALVDDVGLRHAVYAVIHADPAVERSEEHTSELQSLAYLVCRLLLEKKKKSANHSKAINMTRNI